MASPTRSGSEIRRLKLPAVQAYILEVCSEYEHRKKTMADPTALIVVDEADRLSNASLELVCFIFAQGGPGLILIGMPGSIARLPQLRCRSYLRPVGHRGRHLASEATQA